MPSSQLQQFDDIGLAISDQQKGGLRRLGWRVWGAEGMVITTANYRIMHRDRFLLRGMGDVTFHAPSNHSPIAYSQLEQVDEKDLAISDQQKGGLRRNGVGRGGSSP